MFRYRYDFVSSNNLQVDYVFNRIETVIYPNIWKARDKISDYNKARQYLRKFFVVDEPSDKSSFAFGYNFLVANEHVYLVVKENVNNNMECRLYDFAGEPEDQCKLLNGNWRVELQLQNKIEHIIQCSLFAGIYQSIQFEYSDFLLNENSFLTFIRQHYLSEPGISLFPFYRDQHLAIWRTFMFAKYGAVFKPQKAGGTKMYDDSSSSTSNSIRNLSSVMQSIKQFMTKLRNYHIPTIGAHRIAIRQVNVQQLYAKHEFLQLRRYRQILEEELTMLLPNEEVRAALQAIHTHPEQKSNLKTLAAVQLGISITQCEAAIGSKTKLAAQNVMSIYSYVNMVNERFARAIAAKNNPAEIKDLLSLLVNNKLYTIFELRQKVILATRNLLRKKTPGLIPRPLDTTEKIELLHIVDNYGLIFNAMREYLQQRPPWSPDVLDHLFQDR